MELTESEIMSLLDIDKELCVQRQQRLLNWMKQETVDRVLLTGNQHIQYLFGPRFAWTFASVATLEADGTSLVLAPHKMPEVCAATRTEVYSPKMLSTMRNDQAQVAAAKFVECLGGSVSGDRVAVEFSNWWQHLAPHISAELVDLEPQLFRMRRNKSPDEVAKIRKAIEGTEQMYQVARDMIRPGVCELDVYNALQAAANDVFGEPMTATGNDYQVNSRGGSPRGDVTAEAGQLYILDLGPAFRGYFADNARTIAVSEPDENQQDAWKHVTAVLEMVQQEVRPGVSCQSVFQKAQQMLDQAPLGVFNHHLGHGIGLFPHEGPHLNPNWDDEFQVGDVFTAEPGLYAPELKSGMRIENDYLVTQDGVENLSPFPLHL